MRIAAVILAAGASTRFGSPKQLARVGTGSMLDSVVEVARTAGLSPIIAVLPSTIGAPLAVIPIVNDAPEAGMSRSLRLGLAAVPADATAAVVLLGDQPTISASVVTHLVRARGPRPIVAASAGGLLAPPVLIERSAFELADAATGDQGLRDLFRGNPQLVTAVEVGDHAPDVDTPGDLERLA